MSDPSTSEPLEHPPREVLFPMLQKMARGVPFNVTLGFEVHDYAEDFSGLTLRLPYKPELVGNPTTGVLHGGTITATMDAACGLSVFLRKWEPTPIATLDLRIDYMRAAEPDRDVFVKAECYHLGRSVAFVRAVAYHDDDSEPIAFGAGAFMRNTKGSQRRMPKPAKDES